LKRNFSCTFLDVILINIIVLSIGRLRNSLVKRNRTPP